MGSARQGTPSVFTSQPLRLFDPFITFECGPRCSLAVPLERQVFALACAFTRWRSPRAVFPVNLCTLGEVLPPPPSLPTHTTVTAMLVTFYSNNGKHVF